MCFSYCDVITSSVQKDTLWAFFKDKWYVVVVLPPSLKSRSLSVNSQNKPMMSPTLSGVAGSPKVSGPLWRLCFGIHINCKLLWRCTATVLSLNICVVSECCLSSYIVLTTNSLADSKPGGGGSLQNVMKLLPSGAVQRVLHLIGTLKKGNKSHKQLRGYTFISCIS